MRMMNMMSQSITCLFQTENKLPPDLGNEKWRVLQMVKQGAYKSITSMAIKK